MKRLKNLFCVVMCIVVAGCAFAGCASKEELKAEISELENTIDNEITELRSSIASLNTTVAALNRLLQDNSEGLDDLKSQIEALTTKVNELTTKVTAAEARITVLEGIASGENEPKVYQVGVEGNDTFTFVNNGIKLFSVKLLSYTYDESNARSYVNGVITNFQMSPKIYALNYFDIYAYDSTSNTIYHTGESRDYNLAWDVPRNFRIYFRNSAAQGLTHEKVTHFYIGVPNQTASMNSLIPYAKFALPTV